MAEETTNIDFTTLANITFDSKIDITISKIDNTLQLITELQTKMNQDMIEVKQLLNELKQQHTTSSSQNMLLEHHEGLRDDKEDSDDEALMNPDSWSYPVPVSRDVFNNGIQLNKFLKETFGQ